MFGTFLASEIRLLRRMLEARGIDAGPILKAARLDPALAEKPRARYPTERVFDAWAGALRASGDPDFGLDAVRFYRPTDFHGLAVVFLASRDLGTAMARLARYQAVVNTAVKLSVARREDRLDLVCRTLIPGEDRRRAQDDARAAVIVDLCRTAVADTLNPVEVRFTYPKPASTAAHEAMFHSRLVFGAGEWGLSFRTADAERPFLASNRELAQSNDHVLEEVLKSLRHDDLASRVKRAIVDELPSGAPSEGSIARAVAMSGRSLQRRLAAEKTNFQSLLAAVRRELAERYVRDPALPLTEVGYLLGFSDLSSFSRAFKRWTGKSPAASRRSGAASS